MNTSAPGGLPQGVQYLKHWYWRDWCLPVYADGKVSIPSYGVRGVENTFFILTRASLSKVFLVCVILAISFVWFFKKAMLVF